MILIPTPAQLNLPPPFWCTTKDETQDMLAVRQRAAGIAQTARQSAANKAITRPRQQHAKRSYASDHGHGHDHHHHGHGVEESPGVRFLSSLISPG